jgi:dihydropteroate synthase-like protein
LSEHLLFLTGHLAEPRLRQVLDTMAPTPFTFEVRNLGVKVAALMTPEIIRRRIGPVGEATRIVLPGRCKGDLAALSETLGVPVVLGPDEVKDLPQFFGKKGAGRDLSRHDCRIFAEIVEASALAVPQILARAEALRAEGADVIDLGCLPGTPFPHLEEAVQALQAAGHVVSVDSGDPEELRRGAKAGAGYLLSLTEETLDLAFEVGAVPVLIPARHGDLDGLIGACERLATAGLPFLADPILDPIHFGFTASIVRYHELRRRLPEAEILMGVGNLTELTDADTTGITMTLMGMVSELEVRNILVVQVSPHCRRAVKEAELARRILHAAKADNSLPQGYDTGLMGLRDRRPFPNSPAEIAENAAAVADPNFRIEVAEDGVHVYNRDGHHVAADPFDLYPKLGVAADGSHAFYLGVELARAQIAHQLGKRYVQDNELRWGCAVPPPSEDRLHLAAPGSTLEARRKRSRRREEP